MEASVMYTHVFVFLYILVSIQSSGGSLWTIPDVIGTFSIGIVQMFLYH